MKVVRILILVLLVGVMAIAQTVTPTLSTTPSPVITKEVVEARIVELRKEYSTALANLNAISGAIQDCEYWLKQLNPAEPTELKK